MPVRIINDNQRHYLLDHHMKASVVTQMNANNVPDAFKINVVENACCDGSAGSDYSIQVTLPSYGTIDSIVPVMNMYLRVFRLVIEKGWDSVILTPFYTDSDDAPHIALFKAALSAFKLGFSEAENDPEIIIAPGSRLQRELKETVPGELRQLIDEPPEQITVAEKRRPYRASRLPAGAMSLVLKTPEYGDVDVPDELHDSIRKAAANRPKERPAELLNRFLQEKRLPISAISNEISEYIGRTSCYNAFDLAYAKNIRKKTLVYIALAMKLRLEELKELLATGGFELSDRDPKDIIYRYAITKQLGVDDIQPYLAAENLLKE